MFPPAIFQSVGVLGFWGLDRHSDEKEESEVLLVFKPPNF